MVFHHYGLVLFLDSVDEPVEHDFYCFHSRLSSVVESIPRDYDLNYIKYYVINSL